MFTRLQVWSLGWMLAAAGAWTWQPLAGAASPDPPADSAMGEVVIEGSHIVELALEAEGPEPLVFNRRDSVIRFKRPEAVIKVPPGRYRIDEITLEGEFQARGRYFDEGAWFDVGPEQPAKIAIGAPLSPRLTAVRQGTILQLSYELADASGHTYVNDSRDGREQAPRFEVTQDGRVLGSGSFRYG